ncbi:hypothetical protein CMV_030786 [Castanea mollissima]|uniref:Nodulin-like domain-containing protein n=1 Tax=Castanea mollissima TaxID=60419 RepID=A0A8J4V9G7_9ROSI|nr:hypothetical protein CMV_030786 [Castanea mollissima]
MVDSSGGGGGPWAEMKGGLILQILKGRRFMMFGSLLIMNTAGLSYIFSLYSSEIKSSLGYDQTTLNLISFYKDLGANIGIISGLINEITPPWVVLAMGAGFNFFGYFMIWLSVTGRIAKPHVWQMCLYICLGSNSQPFVNTGALVTCIKNFPESRGVLIGVLKGYTGLSGAVITQLYHAIYGDDAKSLILLIAWLPVAICLAFLRTMRIMKAPRQPNELKLLYNFLYISLGLAGFLMIIIILEKRVTFTQSEYGGSAAMVLFLLFLPLAVVIRDEYELWKNKNEAINDPSPLEVTTEEAISSTEASTISVTKPSAQNNKQVSCWQTAFQPPDRGEDYTILQALFSIDMLLIFLATICGLGGTLTVIDNLGQIGDSLEYPKQSISTFVSLVSIWNYLGRVVAVASPIGSYLLNVRVTGHLYDKEAEKQMAASGLIRKAGEDLKCTGVDCFKLSFIIIAAVTFFGTLGSFILVLRTRKFYKSDIYKKFSEYENQAQTKTVMAGDGAQLVEAQVRSCN